MISEKELAKLSYPEAPKIITDRIPGPIAQRMNEDALKYQTPTGPLLGVPFTLAEGLGATMKDYDGNIFLDLTAGVAVSAIGRTNPKIVDAIRHQSQKLMHTCMLLNTNTIELAKRMSSIMPEGLSDNCFTWFGLSGSGAIDTAIKYARAITHKSQIVTFEGGYHGLFYGSLAVSPRDSFRAGFGPFMSGAIHMPYAYCYRCFADLRYPDCQLACAKYFDYKLNTPNTGADDVAAVIVEPIQGEGGYIDPPPGFLNMVKQACDKKGILFIADEIQCGAGCTGKMWAIEHYGVVPDMIVWGKGMGGDQPLSGITVRADLRDKLPQGCHPLSSCENALTTAVALANIDILTDKHMDLMGRAAIVGAEMKNRIIIASKDSKVIAEVRGKGFMIGIELVKDKQTREPISDDAINKVIKKCQGRGAWVFPVGRYRTSLRLLPPLVITRAYFEKGVDIVLNAIRECESEMVK